MACEKEIFRMLGISVTEEEHHSMIGTTDMVMWTRLKKSFGLSQPTNELVKLKQSFYIDYLKSRTNLKPVPYISEMISALQQNGFLLALASSSPHTQIDFILNEFELSNFFSVIVSGDDVRNGKPDPEIFLKASELTGISPEHCFVIEDSMNGVLAAKSANMRCIAYRNPNLGNQNLEHADIEIDSFKDLTINLIKNVSGDI
ncbi:MAG TPA: HAD-IA family hydrolase [Bacteroidales bacterium]|nr:HAD-IA family hydrolase [Bacteroidales bacterium]